MEASFMLAVSAVASATAAIASSFTSIWLAKLAGRTLQVQIEPSVSVDFDHDVSSGRRRIAFVVNDSACDIQDVSLRVSIPCAFEEEDGALKSTVLKCVGYHDLQRWIIPRLWRSKFRAGARAEIDSDSWFAHAREVVTLASLPEEERAMRGFVILDVTCRRAADNRRFKFEYIYRVHVTDNWQYVALPYSGSNPADSEYRIIVKPKNRPGSK
jgi:hypothetical protein